MASAGDKQRDVEVGEVSSQPEQGTAADEERRNGKANWRKIEMLRERAELRDALSDIWDEDPEFEEEIFNLEDGDESDSESAEPPDPAEEVSDDDSDDEFADDFERDDD